MAKTPPWSDDPIARTDQDLFGRSPFASLVAETIEEVPLGSASTVFGLVGPWGSGKSSVASMVQEALPETWITESFTPWAASGIAGLQLEFVAVLDKALGGALENQRRAKQEIKRYVDVLSPFIATAGGSNLARMAGAAADHLAKRKPWSTEFASLSSSLENTKKRVLIVCDDIDRLDAPELLEFLKVVRLLGRFPNVHYLVAYDTGTVEDLLAAEGISGRQSSFMEKIVQHPFELPQIDTAKRWRHVSEILGRTLDDHELLLDEKAAARYRALIDALTAGLRTPRQIARYEQHLRTVAKLVPGEVDLLDFAALAYLRLNHHEVYELLPVWGPRLRDRGSSDTDAQTRATEEWGEQIQKVSRRKDVTGAWQVISFLYPDLRSDVSGPLHPQAFASSAYEERYFSLGVPDNDLSDVLALRAVRSLLGVSDDSIAEEQVLSRLQQADLSVVRLGVGKLRQKRAAVAEDPPGVRRLVAFLWSLYGAFETTRHARDSPVDLILDWLSEEVLRAYTSSELDRAELLEWFGEEATMDIVVRLLSFVGARRDKERTRLLTDFAEYASESLAQPGTLSSDSPQMLRSKIALRIRAFGKESMRGAFDTAVDGDPEAFEALATALVATETWYGVNGSRDELAFDSETWMLLLSEDVRARMTKLATSKVDPEPANDHNLSEANRRRYALQVLRASRDSTSDQASND